MKLDELIHVLIQVIEYYRLLDTDVCFSRYDSTEDAIIDMQSIFDALKNKDLSVLDKLSLLFAPTGSVQESPRDIVTMSTEALIAVNGNDMEVSLVYPKDADWIKKKLSVLSPIGTAILGYGKGDEID